jgi:starch-binding outer membrane protein, SusD/RagB family
MKNSKIICLLLGVVILASCKKTYLNRPSLNNPTLDNYYTTAAQVQAATGYLYNSVWYDYQDKAFHAIGETLGGNMLTETGPNYGSGTYNLFTVLSTDPLVLSSWLSLYKVAGNATVLANTLALKKATSSESYLDQGIAESRFMRGAAYFTIARAFGDVPIVADPVALAGSGNYNVPRYIQKDVLRFVLEDFKFAEQNLPPTQSQKGRVTKYSAAGMMAKVFLYRASVYGAATDYDSAKMYATEVMSSNLYDLYPDYQKMFTSSSANNNVESLFALQWIAEGGYGFANPIQVYAAPSTLLSPDFSTGYNSVYPTLDLLSAYDPNDKRRGWSIMEHGYTNPAWKNVNFPNGFLYDTTVTSYADATHFKNGSRASSLKYIVGPLSTSGEKFSSNGSTSICTYMLRYADVLLIYAEAVLGTAASTSDAAALVAFNKVYNRAHNFNDVPVTTLTKDVILKERRVEFAFEGDWWFDVQRQGFTKAQQIVNAQERGSKNSDGTINHVHATFNSATQLYLPIPQSETISDPQLNQPAVPYYH